MPHSFELPYQDRVIELPEEYDEIALARYLEEIGTDENIKNWKIARLKTPSVPGDFQKIYDNANSSARKIFLNFYPVTR